MPFQKTAVLKYLLPFTYFFNSRLRRMKDILFHSYYEWLPAFIILLYFSGLGFLQSVSNFLLAYLAFIAIYEIGYITNDIYSVKIEKAPRIRLTEFKPTTLQVFWLISFRLLVFLLITWQLHLETNKRWWLFYAILSVVFALHNLFGNNKIRALTFINLAFFRFIAPFFVFLTAPQLKLVIIPIILNYVVYRTYNYLCSKHLLIPKSANAELLLKLGFYVLVAVVCMGLSFGMHSFIPAIISAYYLFFWLIIISWKYVKNLLKT